MRQEIKKSLIVWPLVASLTLSAASLVQIQTPQVHSMVTAWWKGSAPRIQADWEPALLAKPSEMLFPTADAEVASNEKFAALFATKRPGANSTLTYEKEIALYVPPEVASSPQSSGLIGAKSVATAPGETDSMRAGRPFDSMFNESLLSLQGDWLSIQSVIDEIGGGKLYDLTGTERNHVTLEQLNDPKQPNIGVRWLARMRKTDLVVGSKVTDVATEVDCEAQGDREAQGDIAAQRDHSITAQTITAQEGFIELLPARTSRLPESTKVLAKPLPQVELESPRSLDTSALKDRAFSHSPTAWPKTPVLSAMIESSVNEFTNERALIDWAGEVQRTLRELQSLHQLGAADAGELLETLDQAGDQGLEIANGMQDRNAQIRTRQMAHAINRRLAVWKPVFGITQTQSSHWVGDDLAAWSDNNGTMGAQAIDYADLLRKLERQESNPIDRVGSELADAVDSLGASGISDAVRVADAIDTYYRNANVRMAVSESFLNRLLPKVEPRTVPVRTQIMGSRVRGVSQITSNLEVRLLPSNSDWKIDFRTFGHIQTQSVGTSGPVSVRTSGSNSFAAQTPIEVSPTGVHRGDVQVEVKGRTRLRGIRSDYDRLPIIGSLVRSFANSKFESIRPQSNRIVAQQVRSQVSRELNTSLDTRTQKASSKLSSLVLGPLEQLDLDPHVVDMQTTSDRVVARYRLAGNTQLAAFTPRPQAPVSSLMSVQIHQSAINNTLERLIPRDDLMPIEETVDQAASVFGQEVVLEEALPENVMLQFAKTRPVTVEIEDGKMWLTLRIVRLSRGERLNLTNFIVRAAYRPEVNGLRARLIRDGHLRISGPGMSMRQRLPLRTIFNKVLSPDRSFPLTLPTLVENPSATGLAISQLELRSGWIGLAISESSSPRIAWNLKE